MMNSSKTQRRLLVPALALAGVMLAACGRPDGDDSRVGATRPVDPAVTAADKRADELRADAGRATDKAQQGAATAADKTQQGAANMANRAGEVISDATITATVKAALATDAKLSALKIDVDTEGGVVTLSGPAPDETSRARATELAANAKGVVRVENELMVQK